MKSALVALFLAVMLLAGTRWLTLHRQGSALNNEAKKVESTLAADYKDFQKTATDELVLNDLITNTFNSNKYQALLGKPYIFLLYMNDELLLWNSNKAIPQAYLASALPEGNSFLKLDNGYYYIMKVSRNVHNLNLVTLGMVRVKSNFLIENRYLHNSFNPGLNLPDYIDLTMVPGSGAIAVHDVTGSPMFYLKADLLKASAEPDMPLVWLNLLWMLLLVVAINFFAFSVARKGYPWLAFVGFAIVLVGLRALALAYNFPAEFGKLPIFDPQYFASSSINRSLGDLGFNILVLFNIVLVFFQMTPFRKRQSFGAFVKYSITFGLYVILCALSYGISVVFNNLLLNSNIPFDLNNFMSLSGYSLIGLLYISFILFSYLLVTYRLLVFIKRQNLHKWADIGLIVASVLLYMLCLWLTKSSNLFMFTAVWTLAYLLFLRRQVGRGRELASFTNAIVIIILLSSLSAVHLYRYNAQKDLEDRKLMARKLADQRDRITEYLFSDIQKRIFDDPFIRNYFISPFISTTEIQKRIRSLYFGGYFTKYDLDIYLINKDGQPLQPVNADFYALEDPSAELSPPSEYLYFIPKSGGNYVYFGNLPIHYQNKFIGTVILKLSPKIYTNTNLYPELLLEESIKPPEEGSMYSYAIYVNDGLIRKEGIYPYNFQYNFTQGTSDYIIDDQMGLEHLIYNAGDGKKVVVTSKLDTWQQPVTLFSYLFCFYLLFTVGMVIVRLLIRIVRGRVKWSDLMDLTFKDRIQYAMITLLVTAFFIIGFVTVINFTSQYDDYNVTRLVNKEISIRAAVEYSIKDNQISLVQQESDTDSESGTHSKGLDLASLSDVHSMDLNIYDLQGHMVNTSQPDIFSKGLQSNEMDPEAYKYMVVERQSQFIHNETIGSLKYLSLYVPLTNKEGHALGYLNLPFFAKEKELRTELSAFLVTLVNVYVLLLVLGGFFAYLLSNSITFPLSIISDKLKLIQLGRKNEPIAWQGNDEIGRLVNEYNKMIDELENSAELLARSERESAWREMAKQVAHEIKNPLTPMKLSIQHLQRAMQEGRPGVEQLANRVSATLIEQIDNLNHIASEFSNFAKMPSVENEVFDIADVARSVVHLFNEEAHCDVSYHGPTEPVWVYADKNQVLRGFNNLVKNATQAIPDGRKGKVAVTVEMARGMVTVAVQDNGTGISDEQKHKVFVPNFTTKGSGTGLGLAITRQIIENAGGSIWFESTVNVGTTFFVKLPIHLTGRT